MKNYFFIMLLIIIPFCVSAISDPITLVDKNQKYVSCYSDLAVVQMSRHRIPASITLAQGILESGAGQSRLSLSSNNHFGIKCHDGWTGGYVVANDDRSNEKFRKYDTVAESYEDHSLFLTANSRYASLFDLDITDYRGWANGLKNAGYATSPKYAMALISLIERYGLYRFDQPACITEWKKSVGTTERKKLARVSRIGIATPYISQGLLYIIADSGDTLESVSAYFGIKISKLLKFNDLFKGYRLQEGDIVYLQRKHSKYKGKYGFHIVSEGESMHRISQMHGLKLETLYKLNKLDDEYALVPGDTLKLIRLSTN